MGSKFFPELGERERGWRWGPVDFKRPGVEEENHVRGEADPAPLAVLGLAEEQGPEVETGPEELGLWPRAGSYEYCGLSEDTELYL